MMTFLSSKGWRWIVWLRQPVILKLPRRLQKLRDCGFHLAMINKEADIVIGPYLHQKAKVAGVHVTPAHGDQPSLLIALISWVETLCMKVIAAGKSSEYDFVFDPARKNSKLAQPDTDN